MIRHPKRTAAVVVFALVVGGTFAAGPASADMHAACDTFAGQSVEAIPAGPVGYGNVELVNDPDSEALTSRGQLYCPGAEFLDIRLGVVSADVETAVEQVTAAEPVNRECTATATEPCTVSGTAELDPGTYWVVMVFDVRDPPAADDLAYDDTVRSQRFEWTGQGQPVVTCPDAGYVHANPPCPPAGTP